MSYFKKNSFITTGLSINPNYDEKIENGDIVFLTSSVFNFNNCFGVFDTEAERRYTATVFLTDVEGILKDKDDPSSKITRMNAGEAKRLIAEGIIKGGMIPKVECCLDALEKGVQTVHVLDGRLPHSILLEIFTAEGIGTMMLPEEKK